MNIISLSDIHLCRGRADNFRFDAELYRFLQGSLKDLGPVEIILNGDILDLIAVEDEDKMENIIKEISEAHAQVFDVFKTAARRAHLVLVPGNHDHQFKDKSVAQVLEKIIPGIEIAASGIYQISDRSGGLNVLYHFEHGDAHDPWSSLISPQMGRAAKTNIIAKDLIREFFNKPMKIITSTPVGAALSALDRVLTKLHLEAHELRLFEERVKPLIRRFKINARVLWKLANSLSPVKMKEFGKIYIDMIGAEIAHGEEPFYRASAERIGAAMGKADIKIVSFGHTHKPEVVSLDEGLLYANSGTWGQDIRKVPPDRFYDVSKGTYLFFTKETLKSKEGILNYFIPPISKFIL